LTPMGPWGSELGGLIITTVTATSIVFEIVGPILCKVGLQKAGEIPAPEPEKGQSQPGSRA
jgi:hypothetical protein